MPQAYCKLPSKMNRNYWPISVVTREQSKTLSCSALDGVSKIDKKSLIRSCRSKYMIQKVYPVRNKMNLVSTYSWISLSIKKPSNKLYSGIQWSIILYIHLPGKLLTNDRRNLMASGKASSAAAGVSDDRNWLL